jgi:hypothetical protein
MVLSLFIQYGTVSKDELLNWLASFGEPKLKRAPDARIYELVWAVYHDPANGGPSYKELPKYVIPLLKGQGFEASGRRIQKIGSGPEFEPFRRKAGRTRGSQAG